MTNDLLQRALRKTPNFSSAAAPAMELKRARAACYTDGSSYESMRVGHEQKRALKAHWRMWLQSQLRLDVNANDEDIIHQRTALLPIATK